MTVVVPRRGEAGPHSARWAEALGESAAGSVARLESSPTMIDSTFRTALLHVEARCTVFSSVSPCFLSFGSAS
ncbi:hypothetical protein ACFU6I_43515 [Streptomyces sp. NPDC057486]|uniref:hypothetical protein n=1 Tax=Streptomyces sp. NPDC057486 TaxID=3346145 RepID=UPI0036874517